MSEGPPQQSESEKEQRMERIITLARELSESKEEFPFPGIDQEAYEKMKADIEADKDRSLYDISSPTIDELVEIFKNEGMRVALSKSADGTYGRTVFILPSRSYERNFGVPNFDVQTESILLKHLQMSEGMDEKLKELILLSRS